MLLFQMVEFPFSLIVFSQFLLLLMRERCPDNPSYFCLSEFVTADDYQSQEEIAYILGNT